VHDLDFEPADDLDGYLSSHHGQVGMWKAITAAGGPTTWSMRAVITVITVIALSVRRRLAGLVAVTMAGAAVLSDATKLQVHRARPVVTVPVERVGGGSFPSRHALTSVVAVSQAFVLLLPVIGRR
jgi:membrane-associated phospholipid phosphatase